MQVSYATDRGVDERVCLIRTLARIPHVEAGKPAMRVALVEMYSLMQSSGRALRANPHNVEHKMYPVLLDNVDGKLVSVHPQGFMKAGTAFFLPYTNTGDRDMSAVLERRDRAAKAAAAAAGII
jgi:hypothetical protein